MTMPRALSLDLDDTLWPVWPTIARAEVVLRDWLAQHAPATAAAFDTAALRALRDEVAAAHPHWAHDLSAIRRESIRHALRRTGEDPALADPAFEVFFAQRQAVTLYPDAAGALARLSARFPIVALTNGNADLARIGLAGHFTGTLSARELGLGKPDARVFHAACAHLGCAPEGVLHIGDDVRLDVDGAHDAGLPAAWVRRDDHRSTDTPRRAPRHTVPDLAALADALGA